jgi:hypothetical protein
MNHTEDSPRKSRRNSREVKQMPQMTLDLPDELARWLAQVAAQQQRSPEQVAVEIMNSALQDATELHRRYQEFVKTSGLFREISEEEKRRHPPVPEEEWRAIAEKLGKAGPLSEIIIEERGPR